MVHDLQLLVRYRVSFVEASILITSTDLQRGEATVVVRTISRCSVGRDYFGRRRGSLPVLSLGINAYCQWI